MKITGLNHKISFPSKMIECKECGKTHDVYETFSEMIEKKKFYVFWAWGNTILDFEKHTLCVDCVCQKAYERDEEFNICKRK